MRGFVHKSILCFMMIFLLTGVTGCMNNKESVVDKMVAYMNEKYDDHFEYSAPFGGGTGGTASQIMVTSEKFPDADIIVTYSPNSDKYSDNYVNYKYEQATFELLEEILGNVLKVDFLLTYKASLLTSSDFTDETTFETYISQIGSYIQFVAIVDKDYQIENQDAFLDKFEAEFAKHDILAQGRIYFAQTASQFAEFARLDSDALDDMPRLYFTMTTTGQFNSAQWR